LLRRIVTTGAAGAFQEASAQEAQCQCATQEERGLLAGEALHVGGDLVDVSVAQVAGGALHLFSDPVGNLGNLRLILLSQTVADRAECRGYGP
jgi:hypothetical protein